MTINLWHEFKETSTMTRCKMYPELWHYLQHFLSCYASTESTRCWATTQKCPEYRHPIHSIIGWSLMLDETHFFLWDRKYSLSLFSYEGFRGELIVSWLQHDQKPLDWALGTRFSVYIKRLIDCFHNRADLSSLITFNQLQIYDILYQRQTIKPLYIASPNSLPTSTV
jgi:hypothetical protein